MMKVKDLPETFEAEFAFPLTIESLLEQAGDLEIEAPDRADSVTLAAVIQRCDVSRFDSPVDLYYSVVGNLDDAFIGRKYYDDRGMNPVIIGPAGPDDTVNQSF